MNACPCCGAGLRAEPALLFCPRCGIGVTDTTQAPREVAELRQRLASATSGEIALSLPNVLASLNEGSWWELSNGHAVHFSAGSLARYVRAAGFDILNLSLSRTDRDVLLKAVRPASPAPPRFDLEDDRAAISAAVVAFPAAMERQVWRWKRVIEEMLGEGKRLAVLGPAGQANAFISRLGLGEARLERVINPSPAPDVVISLGDATAEVKAELTGLGLRPLVLTP